MKNISDQASILLEKSEKKYRQILETMVYGIQENDCSGTITYSNRAHHDILGYKTGELVGKKIWEMLPSSSDREKLKSYFAGLVKEQPTPEPYIITSRRNHGPLVELQVDWDYKRNQNGKLKGFVSVITDITNRKKIEKDLLRRTDGLATLLDVSRNFAATLDQQIVLQAAVDGITQLTGLDSAAVYLLEEDNLHLRATTPPLPLEFPDALRIAPVNDHPHIRRAIISGEPVLLADMEAADLSASERSVMEQRNLRTVLYVPMIAETKSIGIFIVGSVKQPLEIADAEIDLSITLANLAALTVRNTQLYIDSIEKTAQLEQTLEDRIQAEKEKKKLEEQLQQAQRMESIGRLAGGVAHDFNNMLSVILGHTELALTKIDSKVGFYHDLVQIRNATKQSAKLTRQLLSFARKQAITPKRLDLNQVIGNMLEILRRLIGENIDLVWIPGDDLGRVKMDSVQVDQILANLCVNARDAISGTGKIVIETSNVSYDTNFCAEHPKAFPGSYVLLVVRDDGTGIDKEILSKIFEPYFSTKKVGKGTGLGLSTVYGIVTQNKGFIDVKSEPDKGTTFKIYLPRHDKAYVENSVEVQKHIKRGGRETILLVEDEIMILEFGEEMLRTLGYEVMSSSNPINALILAREYTGTIDLLITDVVMPELNGSKLARNLKTIFPDIKTLFISGYTANVIADHGILHDGIKLLAKPFTMQELATRVREAIDN